VKVLVSPVFVRMAAVLLCGVAAFVLGIVAVRLLRRRLVDDGQALGNLGTDNADAVYPYSAIIQQLKQQKFALQSEQQVQRRRAKTSEHITASMIAHLPCGVVFVAPNGLVRQANAAARQMLGFASPQGLSLAELFRDDGAVSEADGSTMAEVFQRALQGKTGATTFESSYLKPSGEERVLKFTLIPMRGESSEMLGLASVITDESETAVVRRERVLQSETSAEMALELRTSLATIREWAEQMGTATDREQTRSLAGDISAEAGRLEKLVGGFLAGGREDQAIGAGA
jgi:PAS domain S-box-containing protein